VSEMVSQLLFVELVLLLGASGNWARVRSLADDYEGWTALSALAPFEGSQTVPCRTSALLFSVEDTLSGRSLYIPAGSFLPQGISAGETFCWGHATFRLADVLPEAPACRFPAACLFLGAPYLWGGKTVLGVDCSGLVQVASRITGTALPRDASEQALAGHTVAYPDCRCNDLAFFRSDDGRIVHVGIVGNDYSLVHASGSVRLDKLTPEGILRADTGEISHTLAFIKRLQT